ncbi:MAG: hypothetical protein SCK29_14920 [Bacillota bacterium]|nr:hypothetical protein [Bacillota bacterium]
MLEKEAKKFSLKVPTRPAIGIESSLKINELTDKFLYFRIVTDMLSELFSLSRSVRTTLTSDRLRKQFTEFFVSHFEHYEDLNSFGKLKGWEEVTPGFKTPKTKQNEQLSVSDAFHIFDHIRQRYGQIELTMFYESFVHDIDFKASMAIGIRTLQKQAKKLEEVAQTHGIMLPERPPVSMKVPIDPESIEDRFVDSANL